MNSKQNEMSSDTGSDRDTEEVIMHPESSSDSEEVYDSMPELFTQEMYAFLFDKELKFSQRAFFNVKTDLSPGDLHKMKMVNRQFLIDFVERTRNKDTADAQVKHLLLQVSLKKMFHSDGWADDEQIIKLYIQLLKLKCFGYSL